MSSVGVGLAHVSMKKPELTAAGPEISVFQSEQPTGSQVDEIPAPGSEWRRISRCSYTSWTAQTSGDRTVPPNRQTHEGWLKALDNTLALIGQNQRLGVHTRPAEGSKRYGQDGSFTCWGVVQVISLGGQKGNIYYGSLLKNPNAELGGDERTRR